MLAAAFLLLLLAAHSRARPADAPRVAVDEMSERRWVVEHMSRSQPVVLTDGLSREAIDWWSSPSTWRSWRARPEIAQQPVLVQFIERAQNEAPVFYFDAPRRKMVRGVHPLATATRHVC